MDERAERALRAAAARKEQEDLENYLRYLGALRRARARRWCYPGKSRVEHPKFGSVIVPHGSNYLAILNAAEYWGVSEAEIIKDARVWECDQSLPVVKPREFCGCSDKRKDTT